MVTVANHPGTAGHSGAAVLEEEATGDIKGIFEDLKKTFRVPFVSSVFRELAARPDYLSVAWRQLHTNAQTAYFERSADELREFAVEAVSSVADPPSGCPDDAQIAIKIFHYVNPKLLIGIAALRAATTGERPKLEDLPADDKRQIASGVPDGVSLSLVDADTDDERVQRTFEAIRSRSGTPVMNDDALALAAWPEFLETSWNALQGLVDGSDFTRLQRELRLRCEEIVVAFPFRMDLSAHTLRNSGLSEADIDAVHSVLKRAFGSLQQLVAGSALLAVEALGKDEALKSPFPARPL